MSEVTVNCVPSTGGAIQWIVHFVAAALAPVRPARSLVPPFARPRAAPSGVPCECSSPWKHEQGSDQWARVEVLFGSISE